MQINAVGMNTLANNSNALSVNPKFSKDGMMVVTAGTNPPKRRVVPSKPGRAGRLRVMA